MRDIAKLAIRLMVFALVAALLLAGVNEITKEPIARNLSRKLNASRAEVIGDYDFAKIEFDAQAYPNITALYVVKEADEIVGYVYELSSKGYAGVVSLALGVSIDGVISGIAVSSHVETKGLGTADEAPFLRQFVGAAAEPASVDKVDAMTGATVSSSAVKSAVSSALSHAQNELHLPVNADEHAEGDE